MEPQGTQNTTASVERRPYRPPLGIPVPKDPDAIKGVISSLLLHGLLILALILIPMLGREKPIFTEPPLGAGGINLPSGGGGGGTLGSGGRLRAENVDFVKIQPPPPEVPKPEPVKPEVIKPPTPQIKPPEVKPPEEVTPPPVQAPPSNSTSAGSIDSTLTGRGGGSGNDGTAGNGPGTGGGIGTGTGTGVGSGQGPGRGGGPGTVIPPSPTQLFIPPTPPQRVRPYEARAEFDVDSTGRVIGFRFNPSKDRGYNRKLEELFREVRFKPATDWQGRPVRATGIITFTAK